MSQFQPLLTEKQLIFARFYAADPEGHVTKAALAAGCTQASAHVQGSRWLKNAKIQAEVNRLRAEKLTKLDISVEKVLSEIAKIAFQDVRKAFNPDGSLKGINELDGETAAAVAASSTKSSLTISPVARQSIPGPRLRSSLQTSSRRLRCWDSGTSCACGKKTST